MQIPSEAISEITRQVVKFLVKEDYLSLERYTGGVRLNEGEIETAVKEYGRTLVSPPLEVFRNLDIIAVDNAPSPRWSIRCDLWTKEEGRSDLSLELTVISVGNEEFCVELDNIHVF